MGADVKCEYPLESNALCSAIWAIKHSVAEMPASEVIFQRDITEEWHRMPVVGCVTTSPAWSKMHIHSSTRRWGYHTKKSPHHPERRDGEDASSQPTLSDCFGGSGNGLICSASRAGKAESMVGECFFFGMVLPPLLFLSLCLPQTKWSAISFLVPFEKK